jgi:hypothetical protein
MKTKNLTKHFIYIIIEERMFKKSDQPPQLRYENQLQLFGGSQNGQTQKSGCCGQVICPTSSEYEEVILNT